MIGRIEASLRRLRRSMSRSEWLARLLQLSISKGPGTRPGLIMIQIDGLSQTEFDTAIERGELPFLRRLLNQEHYRSFKLYSGLPATTPAVQGELFYGVKAVVPAFSFRHRKFNRIVRMYEPDAAADIEQRLVDSGHEPLLKGGSAYSDNFTGGSDEAHFCPSSLGWGTVLRSANPLAVALLVLTNLYSFLRVSVLLFVEIGLAIADFARGLTHGYDFFKELKFVPTRVAICILLRELCVMGAKIDISRGLPVIHLNFLGFDEQAHRRGPASLFAHWTLKGIDNAIARLWRASNRATHRDYEVWIYSDHGQVATRPYEKLFGRSLADAVTHAFEKLDAKTNVAGATTPSSIQTQRVSFLGGKNFQKLFSVIGIDSNRAEETPLSITSLGPVGFIYPPRTLNKDETDFIATELVNTAKVPLVITRNNANQLRAWTDAGTYKLPAQIVEILGAQHPFLDEIRDDLMKLCLHPEAGDFILFGWRHGIEEPVTFAIENGSHAGASPQETNAFALLPADTSLPESGRSYLRPIDLRSAALRLLGRKEHTTEVAPLRPAPTATDTLRIMTYNVHSCVGMDGKLNPERIARVIARCNPDVVALQELDVGRTRTDGVDQAHLIANYLEMDFHFHPSMHIEEERYGDAILTHLPMHLVRAGPLPGLADKPQLEPRGALWVAIDVCGTDVQVINTHLGLLTRERMAQTEALLGEEWLAHKACHSPVILCADLNALPFSAVCKNLRQQLNDAQVEAEHHRPAGTFFGRFPTARIDYIFIDPAFEAAAIHIPKTELVRLASDHLPLLTEVRLPATMS